MANRDAKDFANSLTQVALDAVAHLQIEISLGFVSIAPYKNANQISFCF